MRRLPGRLLLEMGSRRGPTCSGTARRSKPAATAAWKKTRRSSTPSPEAPKGPQAAAGLRL